jgi:membrane protease subunit HflC
MRSQRVAEAAKLRAQGAELKAKTQADANRERTVIIAEAQKDSQIQRGIGEGAQTTILNDAYGQDKEFFEFYRSMEAYSKAFGKGTTMVLSPDSDFFKFFGKADGRKSKK